jgi:hypothetical protein
MLENWIALEVNFEVYEVSLWGAVNEKNYKELWNYDPWKTINLILKKNVPKPTQVF